MSLMLPPTLDCIIETVSRRIPPVTAIGSGSGKVRGTRGWWVGEGQRQRIWGGPWQRPELAAGSGAATPWRSRRKRLIVCWELFNVGVYHLHSLHFTQRLALVIV